jgi:uncharacterized protein YjbI with pentapeptide repeats
LPGAELLNNANLSGANLQGADLLNADLSDADLSDADLSDASMSRTDLSGAALSGADLSGAYLGGAEGVRCQQTQDAKSLETALPCPTSRSTKSGSKTERAAGSSVEIGVFFTGD